jgi:cytochrome c oxidase assembly protein subunit 15
MTSFLRSDRSRPVAIWLAIVALFVLAMVVVGGATRLTDSGLSITEWKPVAGALPPMNAKDWNDEFARYKEIPQYKLVNRGMSLAAFKQIYWWEWGHRLLGRVLGAVFVIPAAWFLIRQEMPRWLIPRMGLLLVLGGLQGLVGWWMVASGLSERVSVAPERLATHLGLAFVLLAALVWTALDAWAGAPRQTIPGPWVKASFGLTGLFYFQILLGALVAGNDAGLVYNDWPMMNGALFPADYAGSGLWSTLAHSQAAVQFNHRIFAYLLTVLTAVFVVQAVRSPYLLPEVKRLALALGVVVGLQVLLGIVTLTSRVPISLGMAHQVTAAILLAVSVAFVWRVRRP